MSTWACPHCGRDRPPRREWDDMGDGPDPCMGYLPLVSAACCGHGKPTGAYLMIENVQLSQIKGVEVFDLPQDSFGKIVYRVVPRESARPKWVLRHDRWYLHNGTEVALFNEATEFFPCKLELWVPERVFKRIVSDLSTGEITDKVALQDVALSYLGLGEAPTLKKVLKVVPKHWTSSTRASNK